MDIEDVDIDVETTNHTYTDPDNDNDPPMTPPRTACGPGPLNRWRIFVIRVVIRTTDTTLKTIRWSVWSIFGVFVWSWIRLYKYKDSILYTVISFSIEYWSYEYRNVGTGGMVESLKKQEDPRTPVPIVDLFLRLSLIWLFLLFSLPKRPSIKRPFLPKRWRRALWEWT